MPRAAVAVAAVGEEEDEKEVAGERAGYCEGPGQKANPPGGAKGVGCGAAAIGTEDVGGGRLQGLRFNELGDILRKGWPLSLARFLAFFPGVLALSFLGSDATELAAAGMGYMFVNVTGQSLLVGSGAGAQTLISQAFGAANYGRCGDLLQRQLAIHCVLIAVVASVWFQAESVLVGLGQPRDIARLTGVFLLWRIPALPFLAMRVDFQSYLIAQCVTLEPMICSVVSNLLNLVAFIVLIPRLGFVGAPLAITLANTVEGISLAALASRKVPNLAARPRWRWQTARRGWGELLSLGVPAGALMLCEWWAWEMNLFFAGLLCRGRPEGECVELAVFPPVANTMVLAFTVHNGFNMAAGSFVGNALGAGDHARARRLYNITMALTVAVSGMEACALTALRGQWGLIFSSDPRVVHLMSKVIPWIAAYIFFDALGPGSQVNVLRGMGVVRLPALITFTAFYLIGIPCGLWLTYGQGHESWNISGLWAGLDLGMFLMVGSLWLFLQCFVDWPAVAEQARSRSTAAPAKAPKEDAGRADYVKVAVDDAPSPSPLPAAPAKEAAVAPSGEADGGGGSGGGRQRPAAVEEAAAVVPGSVSEEAEEEARVG